MARMQMHFRVGLALVFAAVVLPAKPMRAQQVPPPPPAAVPAVPGQAGPAGPTLQLTMDQAVSMAMETSLDLKAERMNIDVAAQTIAGARAAFLPQLRSNVQSSTSKSPPQDFTQGPSDISSRGLSGSGTVQQLLPWYGSSYSATWSGSRGSQVGGVPTFNPSLRSAVTLNFSQPLWRNLKIDSTRAALETTERQRVVADIQLQQRIVATDSVARNAYLNLIAAIENRKVAQQNIDVAQQALRNAQARVAVGQSASIDIIQSQVQVATFEDSVISADAQIARAEDTLRSIILDPARPDYFAVHLEPTDPIEVAERQVDAEATIKNALANRLDLKVLQRNLEVTDLNLRVNKNAILPAIDFNLGYTANGSGGTIIEYEGLSQVVRSRSEKGFTSVLGDAFGGAYPNWVVGVTVAYPIGRTSAEANLATAEIRKNQQLLQIRETERDIVLQVREAVRQVETALRRIRAADIGFGLAEQQLNSEQRRFDVGLSTNLELQTRQRELAQARITQLNARISYSQALIRLDAVQKVPQ